tara:strand:+ start:288 stop:506 length:219 start_codon:yes stop_codon:yes gene_type:complete
MALSDKVSFEAIFLIYNLNENQVKKIMKKKIRRGSYIAWRNRVFRKPNLNFSNRSQQKPSSKRSYQTDFAVE